MGILADINRWDNFCPYELRWKMDAIILAGGLFHRKHDWDYTFYNREKTDGLVCGVCQRNVLKCRECKALKCMCQVIK